MSKQSNIAERVADGLTKKTAALRPGAKRLSEQIRDSASKPAPETPAKPFSEQVKDAAKAPPTRTSEAARDWVVEGTAGLKIYMPVYHPGTRKIETTLEESKKFHELLAKGKPVT